MDTSLTSNEQESATPPSPIAIVGLSCRVPLGRNLEELYQTLLGGLNAWSKVPPNRYNGDANYHPDPDRRAAVNAEGAHYVQDNLRCFDGPFFNLSAAEVQAMDPQQRQLLEVTYEALENAGMSLQDIAGRKIAVFAGGSPSDYDNLIARDPQSAPMFTATGTEQSILSNRISYLFDLRGPSLTVDTACSSALTALHLAVQELRYGTSEAAIVGCSHLNVAADGGITLSNMQLLSGTGKSFAFDDRAKGGFGRGEGTVTLILKKLSRALSDGDPIRAIIPNSGINQDGKQGGSLTGPSLEAQEALIRSTYQQAGMSLADTDYVEAHGTGTGVGDPIEIQALGRAFGQARRDNSPVKIGSIKSNIGHLEGASGLVSIAKVIMMVERGTFFPNSDFRSENSSYPPSRYNLLVSQDVSPWQGNSPRTASVNNFGFGGSNAHIIVQQFIPTSINRGILHNNETALTMNGYATPPSPRMSEVNRDNDDSTRLFAISAKSQKSLEQQAIQLSEYLASQKPSASLLRDLAFTLGQRRSLFHWRLTAKASTMEELMNELREKSFVSGRVCDSTRIGFVFTGQGATWTRMGRDLYDWSPEFRHSIQKADQYLTNMGANWSLLTELSRDEADCRLNTAEISQPACTALQIALVDMYRAWNVRPVAVVGHSSGEIAAAYAAEILTSTTCLQIAYYRGLVSGKIADNDMYNGSMMALGVGAARAAELISESGMNRLWVACINSPDSVTISGDRSELRHLKVVAENSNIFARMLHIKVAYHSPYMSGIAGEYTNYMGDITPQSKSSIQFCSSLTGELVPGSQLTTEYWVNNLTSPVRFSDGLQALLYGADRAYKTQAVDTIIEIGPHYTLRQPSLQTIRSFELQEKVEYLGSLTRNKSGPESVLQSCARLFIRGYPVDLAFVNNTQHKLPERQVLTNLPSYVWNHDNEYWPSSRLVNNALYPRHAHHDLLGQLTLESSQAHHTWRNVLNISKMLPWVYQHKVNGDIILPGAGYMVMAIEAKRRICTRPTGYSTISLRDVIISSALVLSDSVDTEIMTHLSPSDEFADGSSIWDRFKIVSLSKDNTTVEHCRGFVSGRFETNGLTHYSDFDSPHIPSSEIYQSQCTTPADLDGAYEEALSKGYEFGPLFRTLRETYCDSPLAKSECHVLDTAMDMPFKYESDYLIHPTTLDGFVQVCGVISCRSEHIGHAQALPTGIKSLTITSSMTRAIGKSYHINAVTETQMQSTRDKICHLRAMTMDGEKQIPFMTIEDLKFTIFQAHISQDNANTAKLRALTCSKIVWQPSIPLSPRDGVKQLLMSSKVIPEQELSNVRDVEVASYFLIERAISRITKDQIPTQSPYLHKFYSWATDQIRRAVNGQLSPVTHEHVHLEESARSVTLEKLRESSRAGEFTYHVGQRISDILLGVTDSISVMMEDDRLSKMYEERPSIARLYTSAGAFCKALSHQKPNIRIIEVGGGTGGITGPILQQLQVTEEPGYSRFAEYMFTDLSSGFFGQAAEKFGQYGRKVKYCALDIEFDPVDQGFAAGSYDLVIASNVLHATRDIRKTLRHVKSLLRPEGQLLLLEITQLGLATFPFALTPGWWLAEDSSPEDFAGSSFRCDAPTLSKEQWHKILIECGFTAGIEHEVQDFPGHVEGHNTLMTSRLPNESSIDNSLGIVIIIPPCQSTVTLKDELHSLRESVKAVSGRCPDVIELSSVREELTNSKVCIIIDNPDRPLLLDPTEETFGKIQCLTTAKALLWITHGAWTGRPALHMVSGFANSLRNELTGLKVVTLDVDIDVELMGQDAANLISKILQESVLDRHSSSFDESEFRQRGGVIEIPRMVHDDPLTKVLTPSTYPIKSGPLLQHGRPLKLAIKDLGNPDSMYFEDDLNAPSDLQDDEVEVEPKAYGLNFKEVLIALGQVPGNLGIEASGIVRRVGMRVTSVKPGDHVCVGDVRYATHPRVHQRFITKIPTTMSFTDAASVQSVYSTAYYALVEVARLTANETVLIHAGAGGLGQAAISLANMVGATIFTTCSTTEKADLLVSELGVSRERIFSSRNLDFKTQLMSATKTRGVDVVLNSLAGEYLRSSWECVAPNGRFLEVGKKDILTSSRLSMSQFARNVMFMGIDLSALLIDKPELFSKISETVMTLVANGTVRIPSPITTFGMGELSRAMRLLGSGKTTGKVVIEVRPDDQVMIQDRRRSRVILRKDASYLITGGTGGIGLSACKYLAQQGATSIILLSRSGGDPDQVDDLINELNTIGTKVTVHKCDVGNTTQLEQTIRQCEKTLPPIRGVVHGAMYLKDRLFEGMPLDHWNVHIRAKIPPALNLTNLLQDRPLDFFVMLSSGSGINGNKGQAPYAAASTFLDGYAHHLRERGIPASVLDLGVVKDIGYIAKNADVQSKLSLFSYNGFALSEQDVLDLLDAAMAGTLGGNNEVQCIAGMIAADPKESKKIDQMQTTVFNHLWKLHDDWLSTNKNTNDSNPSNPNQSTTTTLRQKIITTAAANSAEESLTNQLRPIILEGLITKLADVLLIPRDDIIPERRLQDFGIDSLVSVELRNWLTKEVDVNLSMPKLMSLPSILALVDVIVEGSGLLVKKTG